jgi:hypothetical protein
MLIESKVNSVEALQALFHDPDSAAFMQVFVTMRNHCRNYNLI